MIASALKRLPNTQTHFRNGVSVEEQRAQKHDRFLRGRPIAYMIYEHFRATGGAPAGQGAHRFFTGAQSYCHPQVPYFILTALRDFKESPTRIWILFTRGRMMPASYHRQAGRPKLARRR